MAIILNTSDADYIIKRLRTDLEAKKSVRENIGSKIDFVVKAVEKFPEAVDDEAVKKVGQFRAIYEQVSDVYEKELSEYTKCIEILTAGSDTYE